MFVTPINQSHDRSAVEVVEAAANEGKSFRCEIAHFWREIHLPIEPRFDRVLVGRRDVDQMGRE